MDMRKYRQGQVCVLSTLNIVNVLRVLRMTLERTRTVRYFIYLLVKDHFLKLVGVISHELHLNIAQLSETVR